MTSSSFEYCVVLLCIGLVLLEGIGTNRESIVEFSALPRHFVNCRFVDVRHITHYERISTNYKMLK